MASEPTIPPVPRPGDVVIAEQEGTQPLFAVREFPHGTQMIWHSREAAVMLAIRFACLHRVDVWLTDGPVTRPVSRHRREQRRVPEAASV